MTSPVHVRSSWQPSYFALAAAVAVMAVLAVAFTPTTARADDWPAYRHDAARSGITAEQLATPLFESWVFESRHAPQPAWGDPKPAPVENILELRRIHFDDVFQPVAAGGAVYFGSSADNKVYCLDAATGHPRWTFITGGPVRLAPTLAEGRVYVGSDDGYAYCLDAATGKQIWKFRAAPEDRRALGHGRMISLWPLRTGIVVDDGVAYFSAGIFPAEGVFLYAVDAATGKELWRNDTGGEKPQSTISPQGYMLASKTSLYVPMGRVLPATYDRKTGKLAAASPFFGKTVGGTYALLAGDQMYSGTEEMVGYRAGTRDRFASFPGRKMVVSADTAYLATNTELIAVDRKDSKSVRWKVPCAAADALILAGDLLIAGGNERVIAFSPDSGKERWRRHVDGIAKGLAVSDGRLFASTDKGLVYCFAPKPRRLPVKVAESTNEDPHDGNVFLFPIAYDKVAKTILEKSGVRRGYCLVLGSDTGQLALELARQSDLRVYAVSRDADRVAFARRTLDAAGVYGERVCVEQWPPDRVPYADYFANLIVSEPTVIRGELPEHPVEMFRMLKPHGGVAMIGQTYTDVFPEDRLDAEKLSAWMKQAKLPQGELIDADGTWAKIVRGPLEGAGSWTHQYANPGNTACGDDQLVKAPFGVLWFGRPGPGEMVNRHARAASPLSLDGRMFVQGENTIMAYDAYNGLKLWQRDIPGAMRTAASHDSSNLALSRDGLFVAVADKCLRLDPATGETTATYALPPADDATPRRWGYVSLVGKLLYGSRTTNMRDSDCVFAVDIETGEHRWVHKGQQIPHNTIAVSEGRLFLVSGTVSDEQRKAVVEDLRRGIAELPESQRANAEKALAGAEVRMVVALDAATGKLLWQKPAEMNRGVGKSKAGSMTQAAMVNNGVLVLFGVYLDGHYWQQFFAGEFDTRRITALSAEDGELLWTDLVGYRVRPLIIGDTLHAEPWAFDLHTGEPRTRTHPITGETVQWQFSRIGHHCGLPCASENTMFYRSLNLGYYDLDRDYGTVHFGAQRPGCWINFIPAGGLLQMPEASAGCMCAFPNMCTVVFQPTEKLKGWAMYSSTGKMTPVDRLAINFGAPGDRRDADGKLWLGFPRPYHGRLVLPLQIEATCKQYLTGNSVYTETTETDDPWLYASAALGLQKCTIPLLAGEDGTGLYDVRLMMADPDNTEAGRRTFDVKIQGRTVLEDFDVAAAAGGRNKAVVETIEGIEVADSLVIEMVPKGDAAEPGQLPILQGVEIVRQKMLTLGCSVPEFEFSSMEPKRAGQIKLANLLDGPFAGTLQYVLPEGFEVSPKQTDVRIAAGQRSETPIEVSVQDNVPAGKYEIGVRLAADDGSIQAQRTIHIEHLGRRGKLVVPVVEDAFVSQRYPDRNQGASGVMVIDGGESKMADRGHGLAYLKFRLDVPGRAISVRLRIHNAGNPTSDSGNVRIVTDPWDEKQVNYENRPTPGKPVGKLGRVTERLIVECPLDLPLEGKSELSLMIDPVNCDGVDYITREAGKPAELIVEYEPR